MSTRIIIVTIQTFPALFEALDKHPQLASGQYAVVADEAHSSQTGSSATKLKSILGADFPEGEEISAEELLDAAVTARKPSEKISYYAFTATPKAKTLELFGRPPNPDEPTSGSNSRKLFHLLLHAPSHRRRLHSGCSQVLHHLLHRLEASPPQRRR